MPAPKLAAPLKGKRVNGKLVAVGFSAGIKQRKRAIPKGRKHRVRLRAHLRGDTLRRPLTAHERSWL